MKHLPEKIQPAFRVENENDAYTLEWLVRDMVGNEELKQAIRGQRKLLVDKPDTDKVQLFEGKPAQLLLDKLQIKIAEPGVKLTPRGQMIDFMLGTYVETGGVLPELSQATPLEVIAA